MSSTVSISSGAKNAESTQYIFRDAEFEDEKFHAANFVTQYRRVSYSLESLKEQLLLYSEALKQQLFVIINRDYKDFITITTKLDGVDTRLEFMKTPLIDLRTHLTSLHDAVLSSIQSMQDKMRLRVEVSNRRKMIENFLQCLDTIETTKSVLGGASVDTNTSSNNGTKRDKLRRLVAKTAALDGSIWSSDLGIPRPAPSSSSVAPPPFSPLSSVLDGDLFACSEYERAAHCLRGVQHCLVVLSSLTGAGTDPEKTPSTVYATSSSSSSGSLTWSDRRVQHLHHSIKTQATELSELLLKKATAQLQNIFSSAMSSVQPPSEQSSRTSSSTSISTSSSSGGQCLTKSQRQLAHCLRTLITLRQGQQAEAVLRTAVIEPFIKPLLTQGKIDGELGRGSYSGLDSSLSTIVDTIRRTLQPLLSVSEDVYSYSIITQSQDPPGSDSIQKGQLREKPGKTSKARELLSGSHTSADLIINSIWMPVTQMLSQRFPMMCSIGIPNILSECYRAIEKFKQSLTMLVSDGRPAEVALRMATHPSVCAFSSRWKLDIYLQLRRNEIFVRVDKACEFALRSHTMKGSHPGSLLDYLYHGIKASGGSTVDSAANSTIGESKQHDDKAATSSDASGDVAVAPTLLPADWEAVRETITSDLRSINAIAGAESFQSPIFLVFAVESMTCLHEAVALRPMADQFLAILLRVSVRLEAHLAVFCSVITPSFDKAALDAMRQFASSGGSGSSQAPLPSSPAAMTTPSKVAPSPAGSSNSSATPASHTGLGVGLPSVTLQDLVAAARDLLLFRHWATGPLVDRSIAMILTSQNVTDSDTSYGSMESAIRRCFDSVNTRLSTVQAVVWERAAILLTTDCRKSLLSAVKAIAGRYRMTNKPPPDSASPYVESTLQPLGEFSETYGGYLTALGSTWQREWTLSIVEAVTASYCEQVRLLMETVRQMDTALLRRSKMRTTAAASSNAGTMSDSQKINLQLLLDVEAYGVQVKSLCGMDPLRMASYAELRTLITPTEAVEQK